MTRTLAGCESSRQVAPGRFAGAWRRRRIVRCSMRARWTRRPSLDRSRRGRCAAARCPDHSGWRDLVPDRDVDTHIRLAALRYVPTARYVRCHRVPTRIGTIRSLFPPRQFACALTQLHLCGASVSGVRVRSGNALTPADHLSSPPLPERKSRTLRKNHIGRTECNTGGVLRRRSTRRRQEWFGNIRGDVLAGVVVSLRLVPWLRGATSV